MTSVFEPTNFDMAEALRQAMRHMAGAVSVITAGTGEHRTGLTATSATSLSLEPPTMLICVNRQASAWPVIRRHGHFAVNILAAHQGAVADRFAGRRGAKGAARYEGAAWHELASGASGLDDALAVIDCTVEEIIERHSHAIVIGAVVSAGLGSPPSLDPLVYGHGRFSALRSPEVFA